MKPLNRLEVAAMLNVSTRTLDRMIASGEFPKGAPISVHPVWTEEAVEAWMERRLASLLAKQASQPRAGRSS